MARQRNKQRINPSTNLTPLQKLVEAYTIPLRPDGWFTASEISKMTGMGYSTIRRALEVQKIPFQIFRVQTGSILRTQKCYQMK